MTGTLKLHLLFSKNLEPLHSQMGEGGCKTFGYQPSGGILLFVVSFCIEFMLV